MTPSSSSNKAVGKGKDQTRIPTIHDTKNKGFSCKHKSFKIKCLQSPDGSKIDVLISKKFVRKAVDRNKLKRVAREAFRSIIKSKNIHLRLILVIIDKIDLSSRIVIRSLRKDIEIAIKKGIKYLDNEKNSVENN